MRSNTAILALVASASAVNVLPRATPDATKCATELLSVVANLPTPPPALASELKAHPPTDSCNINLPASITADYSSYTSELLAWYTSNSAEISSIATECSITSLTSIIPTCSSSSKAAVQTGKTGNSTVPTAGAPKSTSSKAAGARETGMGFAVLAAAGLAAAVL